MREGESFLCCVLLQDLALCKQYDSHMTEWRRRLDKVEGSVKKK